MFERRRYMKNAGSAGDIGFHGICKFGIRVTEGQAT